MWQNALAKQNSVFANYRLIGSQWTKTDSPVKAPNAPHFLGSITAETYMQNTSSCITCHDFAKITYEKDTIKTDFSFIFGNAK
jgi:mono/diheme cytochrome c family protein